MRACSLSGADTMMVFQSISATNLDGYERVVTYTGPPDECPLCHAKVQPKLLSSVYLQHPLENVTALEVVFQCTSYDCQRVFVGFYENPDEDPDLVYLFADSEPKAPLKDKFSDL